VETGHLLPYRRILFDPVGIKFYPHCLGVDTMKTNLNFNDVFPAGTGKRVGHGEHAVVNTFRAAHPTDAMLN
jgi:hypothetical protein